MSECVFCKRTVPTRGHHIIPRCKGGTEIVPACHSCEDFIHKTWSHNELRDTFNNVEVILADTRFQKFLKWLHKQHDTAVFKSNRGRTRRPGEISIVVGASGMVISQNNFSRNFCSEGTSDNSPAIHRGDQVTQQQVP